MEYIVKARELGEALLQTPEVQRLKEAEAEIQNHPEAAKAFAAYQDKERQILTAQMFSKVVSEKDTLALIDLKMRLIKQYPAIRSFFSIQQDLEKIMATVNLTITTTIYGMPSAEQLPFPKEIQNLAQQLLDTIGGDKDGPSMTIPEGFQIPEGLNVSELLSRLNPKGK
ncbi:YlbF family regulator [Dehalobacter sp.]|uniref:YlbF family regulator n=1 Tax=Dehalobacter sp. TaxID=1962289 RepID=UPI0025863E86|nr:YlbF family regulator [Dehalobacter sp.]MCG1024873.1 YlbF family regulator [Dehalobacter sp.]